MENKTKVEYWLDLAYYDQNTAKAMLDTKRYLYVGFMCHQVVEKSLKAYYWFSCEQDPPYIHNLLVLCERSELESRLTKEHKQLLNELMPLNIQARYPSDKEQLLKSLNHEKCLEIYERTGEFFAWIRSLIK